MKYPNKPAAEPAGAWSLAQHTDLADIKDGSGNLITTMYAKDARIVVAAHNKSLAAQPVGAVVADELRATLHRVMFKDGKASVSQLQREHRMSWDESRDLLVALNGAGWLDGLDVSPHIAALATQPAKPADVGGVVPWEDRRKTATMDSREDYMQAEINDWRALAAQTAAPAEPDTCDRCHLNCSPRTGEAHKQMERDCSDCTPKE